MDLKRILSEKGLTQIELAKKIGANHATVSMQMCKHRLLPKKYRQKFCEIMGITTEQLEKTMKEEGGLNV